jgi:1-deoxy-D-xylulose-5-phosphate synthase
MNDEPKTLLDTIRSPADLKGLDPGQLKRLAGDIRERITQVVAERGGHLASSLGVVELTIALHRTFDFSKDRLVFDVGHQCYPHKLLTGRNERFDTLRTRGGISGFPNPKESPYDVFIAGHASTAISTALGLACAAGTGGPRSVALVGDGAIAGGLAFEALNSAGHMNADVLVVLNDNEMSISKTVGGMSKYLSRLRADPIYNDLRKEAYELSERMPLLGAIGRKVFETVRHTLTPGGVFEALGFRYFGPVNGHDIGELEKTLRQVGSLAGPVLLHVLTRKGEGHGPAEADPTTYHSPPSAKVAADCGRPSPVPKKVTYTDIASDTILRLGRADSRVVSITAAMPEGTGLVKCACEWPDRCYDVGICEGHGVTFGAGLARGGKLPVVVIYSTFLQRAIDSIFHDVCLQGGIPMVLCVDRAGVVGADGPTHHGVFDIPMLRAIPNLTLCAPRDGDELVAMLEWAASCNRPVVVRYPRAVAPKALAPVTPIEHGKAETMRRGNDVAILAYGASVEEGHAAVRELEKADVKPTLVNARFAKPIDAETIGPLFASHRHIVTIEEGAVTGGFGAAVLECAANAGWDASKVTMLGVSDRFVRQGTRSEQLSECGIDAAAIAVKIKELLGR